MTELRAPLSDGLNSTQKAEEVLSGVVMIPVCVMLVLGHLLELALIPVLLWLAVIGEWRILITGLLWAFVGFIVISVLLVLGGLLLLPGMWLFSTASTFSKAVLGIPCIALGVLGLVFTAPVVMTGWTYVVFDAAFDAATGRNAIPVLLMGYYVATTSWRHMLAQENASQQAGTGQVMVGAVYVAFLQLGCLVMVLMRLMGGKDFNTCFTTFLIIMGCSVLVSLVPLWMERKYGRER
ncbi:MAG: hypothetical protein RMJ43_16270 [Chloroherpetonaceae bacterium]|nr:hypothetical protein [Chthonomonadaceae bacterium]MDW8209389.1 hypothetical protein [Chloroherpetonaceae bacterium]